MNTSRENERELFLKYLSDIYLQNPNLPFSSDIVYNELTRFNVLDGQQYTIDSDSLIAVQLNLNNKFRTNNNVNTFSNGYFWVIENRENNNDSDYLKLMYNSVKLYVSADVENIYGISELLFNFMIRENIVMQCKIAKGMRSDALVCRVATSEDAEKVSNYLNTLNYKSKFKPNPFLLENDKVSIAMDGHLSYNRTLSRLITEYLNRKKGSNTLNSVSCSDLCDFIKEQVELLKGTMKKPYMDLYQIKDEERYMDFIMISNFICKNLENDLTKDELYKYQKIKELEINKDSKIYSKEDEDKLLYVINGLANYYSVHDVHKIIMNFIHNGNVNVFTRRDNIRNIIRDNFSSDDVKNIVSNLGWNAFLSASKITFEKYGEEWLHNAIDNYLKGTGLTGFTRDNGVRSRLGLVIPPQLLYDMIKRKVNDRSMEFNVDSITDLVLYEINNVDEKKKNRGRC